MPLPQESRESEYDEDDLIQVMNVDEPELI